MGSVFGYTSLIVFWMCFEFTHLNWELSWPWLTLGNGFSTHPAWVQWYEYTGTSGGTLWILCTNLLFFLGLQNRNKLRIGGKFVIAALVALITPICISYLIGSPSNYNANQGAKNVVIVQPDVDPWNEKFVAGSEEGQLQELIRLSVAAVDSNTSLVVWPETAIPTSLDEDSLKTKHFLIPLWTFLKTHPNLNLLTGIEGYRVFPENKANPGAQRIPNSTYYFESYNSAVLLDSDRFQVYHKSKLVPGAETLPSFIHFMASWFEQFGGTSGSYTRQKDRTVLKSYNNSFSIAPAICYESIYGEFMAEYIRNGADLIAIETNDGWWGNTAGYKQHESYARLRAIETRRWIVRSANTGISCFIDPGGKTIDPQPWDKKTTIKMNVPRIKGITFFVAYGDIISRIAIGAAILLIIWNFYIILKSRIHRG